MKSEDVVRVKGGWVVLLMAAIALVAAMLCAPGVASAAEGDTSLQAGEIPELQAQGGSQADLKVFLKKLGGMMGVPFEYDSSESWQMNADIIYLMLINDARVNWSSYPVTGLKSYSTMGSNAKRDPKGKAEYVFATIPDSALKWMMTNIFNMSQKDYETARSKGNSGSGNGGWWWYHQSGTIYAKWVNGIGTGMSTRADIVSNKQNSRGNYDVVYDLVKYDSRKTYGSKRVYAEVKLKTISGSQYWTLVRQSTTPLANVPAGCKAMYRLYNPNSGEHFYTSSFNERNIVRNAGWKYEGIGWTAPTSGNKVFRLYNKYAGEHHYTTNKAERDMLVKAGWNDEGVGWYSDKNKAVKVYREYNPYAFACNHNYTTNKSEHNNLVKLGWRDEGIAWYGVS